MVNLYGMDALGLGKLMTIFLYRRKIEVISTRNHLQT